MEIESRIISLYDYYFNNSNIDDLEVGSINESKIELDHTKILDDKILESLYSELKSGKFRVLKLVDGVLSLIMYHNTFPCLVKISGYNSEKEILDLNSENNNDSKIAFILSEKVLKNQINLVELPIINFDIDYSKIGDLLENFKEKSYFDERIGENNLIKKVNVRVRERYFKSQSLDEYLKENKCGLKDIIFYISLILSQISHYYPNFSHNNLSLESVNIYLKKDIGKEITYMVGNESYNYKSPGFELKLGYFEKANLNSKKSNDLYNFFNSLKNNKNFKDLNCDKESLEILDKILSTKKISSKYNNMDSIEPISPKKILNSYFKDSRKINVASSQPNKSDYLGKIKMKGRVLKEMGDLDFMNKKLVRKYKSVKNLKGGGPVFKPTMKPVRNNPNISNDARMSYKKYQMDKDVREPNLLAEQKVYQPPPSKPPRSNPNLYPPAFIPASHPAYNFPLPYKYDVNQMPIQNIYNVNLADPRGNHSILARVYEDMTPGREYGLSNVSVMERRESSAFIKSIMINNKEGEDTSLTGGDGSLMEHLMLMELNPYHYFNAYDELPNDYLIYNSAHPIRYDDERKAIKVAKNAVGLNMRMYKLTHDALESHLNRGTTPKLTFNPWRELEYYQKVNDIVKNRKLTQNLVMMHFWVLDRDSRIKYDEIKSLKSKKIITEPINPLERGTVESTTTYQRQQILNDLLVTDEHKKAFKDLDLEKFLKQRIQAGDVETYKGQFAKLFDLDLTKEDDKNKVEDLIKTYQAEISMKSGVDSNVSLGIITESPTHTFVRWASPIYEGAGSLKTMKQSGYHESSVYEAVLFQLIHGLATLQQEGILIKNFKPEYNLLVKDIYHDDRDTKHWRYVVNDVTYYVPNYGYIGMIDSTYGGKDSATTDKKVIFRNDKDTTLEAGDIALRNDIDNQNFELFKQIVNPNFYNGEWRKLGGHVVPKDFLDLITKIYTEASSIGSSKEIKDYMKHFTNLLNNRIGEKVTVTEMNNVDITRYPGSIKKGTLVVRKDLSDNTYKWAVVLDNVSSGVITKYKVQTGKTKQEDLSTSQLFLSNDTVEPKPMNGVKYDSLSLIETYYM